jgi:hypothetical protein
LETSIQTLITPPNPPSSAVSSLREVYDYLCSQHQQVLEETTNATTIQSNLNSAAPFASGPKYHLNILISRSAVLCDQLYTYHESISTIDDIISYIYDLGVFFIYSL